MRIIAGRLKGKPISFLKSSNTRPLKDSVNINEEKIELQEKKI